MIKTLFTLLLSLLVFGALAQKKADSVVYFYKNDGRVIKSRDSADYVIAVLPPDKGVDKKLFIIKGYYTDGRILFASNSTSKTRFLFQNGYTGYYHNGNKMVVKSYNNGAVVGDVMTYYPNGKLYTRINYLFSAETLQDCQDSTGVVLATKGNGKWIVFNDSFTLLKAYGPVVNGQKDGEWHKRKTINDTSYYVLVYQSGNLLSSTEPADNSKIFTAVEIPPEFPGGFDVFYKFLNKNTHYPAQAKENGISGRVIVTFVVERDGSLTEIKVEKGLGYGCDEEAIRVMKMSPSWRPALQRGTPVRVAYSVPISFPLP